MLQMKEVTVGAIGTCCYILWDDARTDCVVIDPGDEPERIRKAAAHDCRDSAHAWAF